ncbi:unnamed protein product, partial [Prorocentrum cordatum]
MDAHAAAALATPMRQRPWRGEELLVCPQVNEEVPGPPLRTDPSLANGSEKFCSDAAADPEMAALQFLVMSLSQVLVWIRSSDAPRALPLPAASLLAELELFVADTAGAAAEAPPGALPWRDPGCAGGLPSYVACLERGCLENAGAPLNGGAAWSRLVEEACQGELAELDLASPDREVPSSRPQRHHRD